MSFTTITTVRNGGNLSRYELLKWINNTAQEHIERIEDLCNGVVYCRLMEEIFPNIINMRRVKMSPRLPYEYVHNMRLLQDAFNILELEQPVPIDLIVQGRFKHNFEFIQYFKKFYDAQTQPPPEKKYYSASRKSVRSSQSLAKSTSWVVKQSKQSPVEVPVQTEDEEHEHLTPESDDVSDKYPMPVILEETEYTDEYQDVPPPSSLLPKPFDEVKEDIQDNPIGITKAMMEAVINQRNFAYHKLIMIEQQIADNRATDEQWMALRRRIVKVLWATLEDEIQAEETAQAGHAADPALPPQ